MIWFSASCTWTNLPNSVGLLALPLRMISVCGSIAHDLAWKTRDSLEDPGLGLLHHLPHSLGHEFQCFRHLPHPLAATRCKMLHLLHHALGLIQNLHRYLNPCSKIRRPSSRVACRRLTSYWASFRQVAAPKNCRFAKTSGRPPQRYVFRKTSTAASNAWNEPRQRSASLRRATTNLATSRLGSAKPYLSQSNAMCGLEPRSPDGDYNCHGWRTFQCDAAPTPRLPIA